MARSKKQINKTESEQVYDDLWKDVELCKQYLEDAEASDNYALMLYFTKQLFKAYATLKALKPEHTFNDLAQIYVDIDGDYFDQDFEEVYYEDKRDKFKLRML